jgi:hypothetical protein
MDAQATRRDLCRCAYQREGIIGLLRAAWSDLTDLIRTVVRARFGRSVGITGGHPPNRFRQKGQSTMQTLIDDVRLAIRGLRANPAPTLIAILTLALGIGVTTAVFSAMDSLLIRPAPFTEAHRLVEVLNFAEKSKVTYPGFGRDLLREWRGQTDVFDRLEAYSNETIVYQGQSGAQAAT